MRNLVRFRADPQKVRVTVRHVAGEWAATVASKSGAGLAVTKRDASAIFALEWALEEAERLRMPGVDLGLEWAYEHPQDVMSTMEVLRLEDV